jgi:hypothetical protein
MQSNRIKAAKLQDALEQLDADEKAEIARAPAEIRAKHMTLAEEEIKEAPAKIKAKYDKKRMKRLGRESEDVVILAGVK